jgi:hypothetical protein
MQIAKRITTGLLAASAFLCSSQLIHAQGNDPIAAIQQKLDAQFVPAKLAGNGDILTAGSVLVLQKDGLHMSSTAVNVALENTYKNGKLSWGQFSWSLTLSLSHIDSNSVPQRNFVSGEKFWFVADKVDKNGVHFKLWTDPDSNNIRYYALLKIPFSKGPIPSVDDVMKTIAEVLAVDAPADAAPAAQSAPPPAPEPPSPPAMAPIAPPPPPPVAPKTIALGQTKDEVVAILGQPDKVANVGTKEIDYYPDMKVILIKGKVTDIQ